MRHRILMKGPFLSLSGYGYQARFALEAIRSREDIFDIFIVNTGWGQTSWIASDSPIRKYVEEKTFATMQYAQAGGQFDINLQVTIPNEIEQHAPVNILYTAGIETTRIAPEWIEKCNLVDKLIVVSNHAKQGFKNTTYVKQNQNGTVIGSVSCTTPIDVVNYAVKRLKKKKTNIELNTDFNFLTMAQWGPRKDLGNTIRAFLDEFWEDEVGLVVKTSIQNNSIPDRSATEERLDTLIDEIASIKSGARKCKLYLIHGALTDAELQDVYTHKDIKAFVTSTHGEGFGLSIFESAYNGLPVIAPGWSGQCDYLFKGNKALFTDVKYSLNRVQPEAVWPGVIDAESSWCFVDYKDLKVKMREIKDNYKVAAANAKELQTYLLEEFTLTKKNNEFVESVLSVVPTSNIEEDDIDSWLNDMSINLVEAE